MTSIVVFKPPEETEIDSTKTEREIQYEKFEQAANIDPHHFKSFMEMVNYEESIQETESTLPSILIKSILPYCIPIIQEIPKFTVKIKTVEIAKKKKLDVKEREKLREAEQMRKGSYAISVQLETPIRGYLYNKRKKPTAPYEDKDLIIIPTRQTFNIMGLVIPQKISKTQDASFLNYELSIPITEILTAGRYGIQEFQSELYTQSRIAGIHPSVVKKYEIVHFSSDDDAKTKINAILRYVTYNTRFYEKNLAMVYNYLQNKPFSTYLKAQTKLYNVFNSEFQHKHSAHKHSVIAQQLAKINNIHLHNSEFANNFSFDKLNVFNIYNQINMLGMSNPFSKKLLQDLDQEQSYEKTIVEFNKLKFKKKLEYAKKKAIAINKFQIGDLTRLTDQQRKVVNLEFVKLEKFYRDMNKHSDDFALVDTLFWAIANGKTALLKNTLKDIEKKVKVPKKIEDAQEILQTPKKVALICPHVIARARKIIAPAKSEMQKSGEIRTYLIDNFSLPVNQDGYFCRICGELLAEADEEEITKFIAGKRVSFVTEYDQLKSRIWKEVAYVMTVYVKFKDAVNHKNIITSMTNALRPEMGVIETSLAKIKSNSKDSIKDLMSIYIAIYTFAMVVHMIDTNYGKITFTFRTGATKSNTSSQQKEKSSLIEIEPKSQKAKGGRKNRHDRRQRHKHRRELRLNEQSPLVEEDSSKYQTEAPLAPQPETTRGGKMGKDHQIRLQNIINNALFLVLRMKSVTINDVASINRESVKPILIKAYKWASTLKGSESSMRSELDKEMPDIERDNVYNYFKYANQIASGKLEVESKKVLGREWTKIEKEFEDNISIYATATIPTWGKTDEEKYNSGSFKSMADYVKGRLYNKNAVPYSKELSIHDKQYQYLHDMEETLYQAYLRDIARPFNNIVLQDNYMLKYNNFDHKLIKIENYYDNNGHPHKFDIFVYQKANAKGVLSGTKKEYTKKDTAGWAKDDHKKLAEFKNWFIVDEKCSVCGVLLSKTKNVSVEKSMQKLDNLRLFYEYYENRCPKGELHDYTLSMHKSKENSCKKCGVTSKMLASHDKKYYDKYNKNFEKTQEEKLKLQEKEIVGLMKPHKDKPTAIKYPDWKVNNAPILELARSFKIKYNTWVNLGLGINQKHSLIEAEKLNPSTDATPENLRLRNLQLYNYYLYVVSTFYLIKNYDISPNLPYDLKQIMAKNKVANLRTKLMDVDKSVPSKYIYYKDTADPKTVSNFLLYTLSQTLLNIHKSMKKAGSNVANDAVKYIINSIIASERILGEPDYTKFKTKAITAEVEDTLDADLGESDDGDDAQDDYNTPEQEEKSLEELGDSDPEDEFALNDMDIERDEEENLVNNVMDF